VSTTDTLTATNTDSYNTYSSNHGNSRNRLQQGYSVMSSTERHSDLPEFNYNSSDVIQRVYIKHVGWVSQMNDGCLWCHFDDGTRLAIQSHESAMQYTDNSGGKPTSY